MVTAMTGPDGESLAYDPDRDDGPPAYDPSVDLSPLEHDWTDKIARCHGCGRPASYDAENDVYDHRDPKVADADRCRLDRWHLSHNAPRIDPAGVCAACGWLGSIDPQTGLVRHSDKQWDRGCVLGWNGPPEKANVDPLEQFKAKLLTTTQISDLPEPEWLVRDWLMRDSLAMLFGPSGTYKTFLALDLALHVATGSWWHGHHVDRTGRTLYVIAEGARGIGRRLDAWKQHARIYDLDDDRFGAITWLPTAVNLTDMAEMGMLQAAIEGQGFDLVVIDTYARCTLGAEENSSNDAGKAVAALDRLRHAAGGACVLVVHHTGKDTTSGARGSSALKAAMDTELEVVGGDQRITLRCTKQKDAEQTESKQLAPLPVGDSLVLVHAAMVQAGAGLSPSAQAALTALREVELPNGVSNTVWKAACAGDVADRSFYRAVKSLLDAGLVRNISESTVPRYVLAVDDLDEG